jgi:hypothetical protein
MDRVTGFYWVKNKWGWFIAFYNNQYCEGESYWERIGIENTYLDSDFEEIDENQIIRNNGKR